MGPLTRRRLTKQYLSNVAKHAESHVVIVGIDDGELLTIEHRRAKRFDTNDLPGYVVEELAVLVASQAAVRVLAIGLRFTHVRDQSIEVFVPRPNLRCPHLSCDSTILIPAHPSRRRLSRQFAPDYAIVACSRVCASERAASYPGPRNPNCFR